MSDLLCVTDRRLCREDFLTRIEKIAAARPGGILLREKDLSEAEYTALARRVLEICGRYEVPCILHRFVQAAMALEAPAIHLPLPLLRQLTAEEKAKFPVIGASCHAAAEAREAYEAGCTYIIAGHIFETDCKKGLPGRGTDFLRETAACVPIPVYAIGGIRPENIRAVRAAGAAGACVMSGAMQCPAPLAYFTAFEE